MDFREQFEIQKEKDTAKEGSYLSFEEQFRQNKAVRDSSGITELLKANIKDPGEAAAVAGMTYTLADHFKQDPVTILKDLPGWAAKYNGIVKDNKGAWQQIWDAAKTGWATDRLGRIGSALMVDRTPEDKQRLIDEAASIRAGIPGTEGDSQSLGMKIATSSANLLGTMVRPLVTNLLVSALIPEAKIGAVMGDIAKGIPAIAGRAEKVAAIAARATGHGAPFLVTWADTAQVESGNIYLDMLDAGVDEDIARKYAGVHGAIAGALEAAPLEFAFTRMPVYRKAAQTAFNRLCGRAVSKAGVAKTMSSALSNAFINIASSTLFETVTEVAQEGSAVYFEKKAALALPDEIKDEKLRKMLPEAYGQWRAYYEQEVEGRKDYYESQEYKDYVADRVWDVLVQTALGTAPLSFLGASGQAISDVKYTQSIKKEAEVNPSKLNFIKRHFNDRQFDEIPKEKRAETLAQIYEDYHSGERVDAVDGSTLDTDYIKINESEEMPEGEEQASEAPAEPPKRRKDNRLHIQEAIRPENTVHHDDGSVSKTILLGTTDNNKRYGQINFTVKDNDITIDSVKMRAGQQALTEEFITDFMQRYKGYNISWEPASEAQKKIRENLLNVNKGTKYEGQLQQFWGKGDREQINKTARLIQDKFKNFTPDQAMVGAELLDLLAQKRGKTLSQLVSDDMGKGDIRLGTVQEGIEAGVLDADEVKNKRGAIQWAADAGKAFIWVGEKGDFSTLGHEVTHFVLMTDPEAAKELAAQLKDAADTPQFRQYLDEHRKIMEGVTESKNDIVSSLTTEQILDQIKSLPDDVEKWTTTQHEIAAVLAETYLQEGETFNPELKSLFDKIIDWFLKIYGMLKRKAHLNEGIIKAYDNLFTKNPELKEKYEAQQQAEAAQQGAREQGKTMFQGATPEELAEAEKQYAETEAKYKDTDQWMKAPNGKPTKLTERQWVQVRTPLFKAWFGDWENDPDNASKVVDENGEPRVVYHGSSQWFTEFNNGKQIQHSKAPKNTIFATADRDIAMSFTDYYGATQRDVILDENSPLHKRYDWGVYREGGIYSIFINSKNPKVIDFGGKQWNTEGLNINDVVSQAMADGYDGVIADNVIDVGFTDVTPPPTTDYVAFSPNQIKSATDNVGTFSHSNPSILYQPAFHGSGANFDKFDTDFMGTGEGSQSFGWGIYLAQSEAIGKDYAERKAGYREEIARNEKVFREALKYLTSKKDWKIKGDIERGFPYGWAYEYKGEKVTPQFINTGENIPFAGKCYAAAMLEGNFNNITNARKFLKDKIKAVERELKGLDGIYRNLYSVTIPDEDYTKNGKEIYLYWDKPVGKERSKFIADELYKKLIKDDPETYNGAEKELKKQLAGDFETVPYPDGKQLYGNVSIYLGSDKAASKFLNSIGYVGIDYPAGTIMGGGENTRNFVIFNPDDIIIDKHTMWQNELQQDLEADLMKQAKGLSLDEWIDFNKFLGDENLTDDQLKAIWERANSATKTAEGATVISAGAMTEDEKDTAFYNLMQTDDGIRNFIRALRFMYNFMNEIDQQGVGQEDIEYLDKVQETLNLANSAAPKITMIAQDKTPIEDIKPETIKNIRGMIVNNLTDYRDLYARAAGSEDLAVSGEALPLIQEPTAETQRMSFAERKAYADRIEAQELKKKILKGEETYEGEAQKVVKYLDSEIKKGEVKIKELQEDIGHKREALSMKDKKLLKDAEEKKEVEKKLNKLNATIRSKLDKGVRISTEEYKRRDSLMERLDVLKEATAQLVNQTKVKALADKQDALQKLKDKYKKDMEQRRLAREIIAYKKKLWNGIMRKVSRNVNWEQTEVINAIHRLLGGVSESTNENITLGGKSMTLKEFREGIDKGTIEVAGLTDYQLKRYLNKTLADFTIQELEELYDTVRYLTKTGRQEWQAKVDQRNYEAQQYRNILINEIISSPKFKGNEPLPETTEAIKKSRDLMTMFKTAWYKTLNMARKAQILDNGRKAMAYKLLISEKRDIQDAEYRAIRNRIKKIDALMEKLKVKPEDFYEQFTLDIKGLQDSTYTLAQLIYGVKAQLEERNRQAFAYGNLVNQIEKSNYTDEQIEEIGDRRYQQFTEQAQKILDGRKNVMKIAEAIWGDWQDRDNFERLNRAAIEEYNQPVNPVQFYMPIARKDFNGTELSQKIANDIYNLNAGKGMTSVEKGMIKDRITISARNQQPVDADYFKLWSDSVAEQEHFIATNAYVRKLNRIFKAHGSKDLQAYIQSVYGNGMLTDINNFINEVANPEVSNDTQGINRYLSILRGALYPAYLAFKASSVILQMITSPAPFLREVGPLELAKGLIQMSMHPVETWKYVTGLSSFMENRSMNPFVEEIKKHSKDYTKSKAGKAWDKFREVGTAGLEMADKWAVTAGWLAVYDKKHDEFIESGMTEEEAQVKAVKYADDVVYETQPLGDKTELAPLFKGGSPAWQAFTQFQVSLNVIWNNLTYDVAVGDINGHEYRKMMGTLIGYALAGAILYSVQEGWGTEDDDTAEEKLLKMLRAIAYGSTTQFTSAVPLLSNNADAIVKKMITGEKWQYRTNQLYPGFDELTMGIATTDWKKIRSGAAKLGGVPVSGPKEFWHAIHGREAGDWRLKPGAFLGRRDKKK